MQPFFGLYAVIDEKYSCKSPKFVLSTPDFACKFHKTMSKYSDVVNITDYLYRVCLKWTRLIFDMEIDMITEILKAPTDFHLMRFGIDFVYTKTSCS
jgi:hypothetical protein